MIIIKDLLFLIWKCILILWIIEYVDYVVYVNYLLKYSFWFLLLIFFFIILKMRFEIMKCIKMVGF